MPAVAITLLGRTYQLGCAAGEEDRLKKLAEMLEAKMRAASTSAGPGATGEVRLLMLAGLMLADEILESQTGVEKKNAESRRLMLEEEDLLIEAVEHLSGRINSLAAKVAAA
jgi:cell division protein ZapA